MNSVLNRVKRKCLLTVMAQALMLLGSHGLAAVTHSDFDPGGTYYGGTEGWFNYDGMLGFTTSTPTGGSTLWLDVIPQQYWGKITSQNWAVPDVTIGTWNSSSSLEFDVIVSSSWFPNNAAQQISVEFQVGGGVNGTVNKYANPTINTALKDTIQHVSIPLASLQPFEPDATFWNLSMNLSPGYAWEWDSGNPSVQPYNPHYYLDNITWVDAVVPEPSAGLMTLVAGIFSTMVARRFRVGAVR
jgi:hypothetical protein